MIVSSERMSAEAELGSYPIHVTYGELVCGHVEGVTERIGHFLEPGEEYPETESELRAILRRIAV